MGRYWDIGMIRVSLFLWPWPRDGLDSMGMRTRFGGLFSLYPSSLFQSMMRLFFFAKWKRKGTSPSALISVDGDLQPHGRL
jgi:hypothetical protein